MLVRMESRLIGVKDMLRIPSMPLALQRSCLVFFSPISRIKGPTPDRVSTHVLYPVLIGGSSSSDKYKIRKAA